MRHNTIKKYSSRLMAVLLALVLLIGAAPAARAEEIGGSCGENLTWDLQDGILTISGSGDMTDFPESTMAPWYAYREEIVRVELPEKLRSVGDLAFYGCDKLTAVIIPDSVTRVGQYAFFGCKNLEMLSLGAGLTEVEECAFSDCVRVPAIRLPDTLQTIGVKAFYRCEAIAAITIPASVTKIGTSAFAYCKNLVSANVQANISVIPEWLFYRCEKLTTVILPESTKQISEFSFRGCEQLHSVHYNGEELSDSEIETMIAKDVAGFDITGAVTDEAVDRTVTSATAKDNGDGTFTQTNVTVTETNNASVSAELETHRLEDGTALNSGTTISVTINDSKGWEEIRQPVDDALRNFSNSAAANGGEIEEAKVNVYIQNNDSLDPEFVESISGRDVQLSVITKDGSAWRIDGNQMDSQKATGHYDLRHAITQGSQELNEKLQTNTSFVLEFAADAEVNAEVLIYLGIQYARQNATLFQQEKEELVRWQTVVVDQNGYAHFYLGSVIKDGVYYIAMNVAQEDGAIIPEEMQEEYGNLVDYNPVRYEITGRKSSWGMTFNQVTWILAGFLAVTVITVGIVMYSLNKRKLRMGYVPDLEEDDYE